MKLKKHNSIWQNIPDHIYSVLINFGSRSGKAIALSNLINYQTDTDFFFFFSRKIYIGTKLLIAYNISEI